MSLKNNLTGFMKEPVKGEQDILDLNAAVISLGLLEEAIIAFLAMEDAMYWNLYQNNGEFINLLEKTSAISRNWL